jgi:hypothetical protein
MYSGRTYESGLTAECRTLGGDPALTGVWGTHSDSISEDFRLTANPICEGQRQTNRTDQRGITTPCLAAPYNTNHFPFWNQLVANELNYRSRQSNFIHARPEKGGARMATLSHFCASLLYGVFSGSFQTQDAVFMAKPEV